MDTAQFLRAIWPTTGYYVIGRLIDGKFRHTVCETVEEAAMYALQYDSQGVAVYHACAAYREREIHTTTKDGKPWTRVRIAENVQSCKAFWMDLDVKPGNDKAFESQGAAIEATVDFCNATALPLPMFISSGGGVHLYWILTHDILPEQWGQTAKGLKALSAKLGFKSDPACTSDSARVLRPIGTFNRKDPNTVRSVELVADSAPVEYAAFSALVAAALKAQGVKAPEAVRQVESVTETINQAFAVQKDFPPCSAVKVASRCKQVGAMRDSMGCVPEPHWYAVIQLMTHAVEGEDLIHTWSSGYEGYTREETDKKIAQVRDMGPPLCSTFADRNPGGCDGCPFQGKISSPVQLGAQIASAPAPVIQVTIDEVTTEVTLPEPPWPFKRGEKGGVYITEDDIEHKIYEFDIFPTELAFDEQLGYETMRIRHFSPKEGWNEFVLQSSLLAKPTEFEIKLRDNHVQPLIRNKIAMYFDAYIRKLRSEIQLRKLFKAQGWKNEDTEFVLGDRLYRPNEVIQAGHSSGAKGFLEHFRTRGELAPWRDLTSAFDAPGLEPHAFMLLIGFASPLLKLAGRKGFTISALGDSGTGKSTMGQMLASIYGHPEMTWGGMDDTQAARYERLGAYYSLPMYIDEASTIDNEDLRRLVYSVATGKGRNSLKQDRTLREGVTWATVLVTSTNDSLMSKLQLAKQNPEAEAMRLFEFKFPRVPSFAVVADLAPEIVAQNYGLAGAKYIEYVVNNLARIKAEANNLVRYAHVEYGMAGQERFWAQAAALSIYGGKLAREAGVIDFDPERIKPWLLRETQSMRSNVADNKVSAIAILAQYLNAHIGERLVVSTLNKDMALAQGRVPSHLSQRFERDSKMLWFPKQHAKHWFGKYHFNANEIREELSNCGVLIHEDVSKNLGSGTDYSGGPVRCWQVSTNHPELDIKDAPADGT